MNDFVDPFAGDALGTANVKALADASARTVLALDLGTSMGWALRTSACVTSGAMDWRERRGETRGDRLLRLERWLRGIQRATPIALLAYELVQHMGPGQRLAAHAYAQFEGIVLAFASRNEIPVSTIHVLTLKKAITGTARHPKGESKEAMLRAVRALGFTPASFDEADALGVLEWAIHLRGKQ